MAPNDGSVVVFVTAPLPDQHIDHLKRIDPRLRIIYDASLIPERRYIGDAAGKPLEFTPEMEERWCGYLSEAEVMFGFDYRHLDRIPELAPRLKWIQGTSTGIGPTVVKMNWNEQGIVTTGAGTHAVPLAEFVALSMLSFAKNIFHLMELKEQRQFVRHDVGELHGKTLGIIGLGRVGTQVAHLARAFGMRVLGTKRTVAGLEPALLNVDELYASNDLADMLERCDYVVTTLPPTPETENMMNAERFRSMKQGSVFINVSRGALVVEEDLIAALESGHLRGAALDVFVHEPLPEDSPFWSMDNVFICPHSAALGEAGDVRITNVFVSNLQRYLAGRPLLNVIRPELGY